MSLQKTGTVSFKINHDHADWATNDNKYKFGPFHLADDLDVVAFKTSERILEIRVAFAHFWHTFSGPVPDTSDGLSIALTWSENEITLWVNGNKASTAPFKPVEH